MSHPGDCSGARAAVPYPLRQEETVGRAGSGWVDVCFVYGQVWVGGWANVWFVYGQVRVVVRVDVRFVYGQVRVVVRVNVRFV